MSWWGVNIGSAAAPGFDELDVVGGKMWSLGLPDSARPEFRRSVVGAAVASVMGIGVEYALKRYVGPAEKYALPPEDEPFRRGLLQVRKIVVDALERTMRNRAEQKEAAFVADSAVIRLQNTFRGAVILIKSHMHFETSALLRLIVEQLAWAWAIHDYEGDYWDLQPHRCIGQLKVVLPHIGNVYGSLSESAHVVPPSTRRYIHSSTTSTTVYFALPAQTAQDLLSLIRLAVDFACVCELLHPESDSIYLAEQGDNIRGAVWPEEVKRTFASVEEWARYVEAQTPPAT